MPREITDLDTLKSLELDMMKLIHQFCEEKGITYYIAYGTLLGTVRHNGFIPWDDDIDIHIPRLDFIRFEKEFPEWGQKYGLYIAGPHSKEYFHPRDMMKVCDSRTELLETDYRRTNRIGVFVDIWPLDNVPDSNLIAKLWVNWTWIKRQMMLASDVNPEIETGIKAVAARFFGMFSTKRLMDSFEKSSTRFKNKKTNRYITYQATKMIFEKKWFEKRDLHRFEDTEFYIPHNYHEILTVRYGDYMKLPPEDKRVPHHVQNTWWKD